MAEVSIALYEFSDFQENPELIKSKEAVQSIMGQLILSIASENSEVFSVLYMAKKKYFEYSLPAPMAVTLTSKGSTLYVNPQYFIDLYSECGEETFDIYKMILYHEASHIIHLHPLDAQYNKLNPKIANYAYDVVINESSLVNTSLVEKSHGVTLRSFSELLKHLGKDITLKPDMSSTYYYNILKDAVDNNKCPKHSKQNQDGQEAERYSPTVYG